MDNKNISFFEKKLFKKHQTSFLTKNKRSSKSTSYISVKEAQKSLLNSLSKNNDDYIIREYSKINPQDFNSYIETVDSSLNNYMMDYESKKDDKSFKHLSPSHYMNIKDKLLIKKVHNDNINYLDHALTPHNEESNMSIKIKNKQYSNPYQSLAVIKHNSLIFDEINKDFLKRQGDLFKQKILNIKKFNNKYSVKMPKIHISNFSRVPFDIPLVDLTDEKDKKGFQGFKDISNKQKKEGSVQLYAYYLVD